RPRQLRHLLVPEYRRQVRAEICCGTALTDHTHAVGPGCLCGRGIGPEWTIGSCGQREQELPPALDGNARFFGREPALAVSAKGLTIGGSRPAPPSWFTEPQKRRRLRQTHF